MNLAWAMDRLRAVLDAGGSAADLVREAEAIHDEDVAACERIGDLGADLVRAGEQLLTHCNAGALATAGIGSALGVIHRAHARRPGRPRLGERDPAAPPGRAAHRLGARTAGRAVHARDGREWTGRCSAQAR